MNRAVPDPVPVSPAAQAVETPELWWSPSLEAITETGRGAVHVLTRSGVLDVTGLEWANLPADAVRLVPAPGPDTEAGALKLLAELVEVQQGPKGADQRRREAQAWQQAGELLATARGEDPLTEHNGDEWFGRRVAKHGPCTCGAGDFDVCLDIGGCALCTALPAGWPCVAEGGYDDGAWVGPTAESAGVRTDGETPQ